METGIEKAIKKIRAIGLYEPGLEEKLTKYHEDLFKNLELTIYKAFSSQQIRFDLYLSIDHNNDSQIQLTGYDLFLPHIYPLIEHQVNNGFNSQELEERMQGLDWNRHPGDFFYHRGDDELMKMDGIINDLEKFIGIDDDRLSDRFWEMSLISGALLAKYLTGTSIATKLMMNLPYFRGTFYDMYPFPPHIHASVGGNSIHNLAYLKKLSDKAMDSYDFVNRLRDKTEGLTITEKAQAINGNLKNN